MTIPQYAPPTVYVYRLYIERLKGQKMRHHPECKLHETVWVIHGCVVRAME